jgi:hypothetical protein
MHRQSPLKRRKRNKGKTMKVDRFHHEAGFGMVFFICCEAGGMTMSLKAAKAEGGKYHEKFGRKDGVHQRR